MRKQNTDSFNKEKLIFMLCSAAFSLGLYLYLASSPVPLVVPDPISLQSAPTALVNKPPEERFAENFYVANLPGMIDKHTNEPINRARKTPFAPASGFRHEVAKPKHPQGEIAPPPPPPAAVAEERKNDDEAKKFNSKDLAAELDFMGVVMLNGEAYGLLKPKDGSNPRRVKAGDLIPELNYTVTKIEKQAIYVTDADKHPFVLKDTRFSDDEATDTSADNSKPAPATKTSAKPLAKTPPAAKTPTAKTTAANPIPTPKDPNTPPPQRRPGRQPRPRPTTPEAGN